MNIASLYSLYLEFPHITTDTRTIRPGSIYFALRGEKFDGNVFAQDAINCGAAYAVIDRKEFITGKQTILVEDTLTTLQQLALHHRRMFSGPVIAITGTNGKTTTKELIKAVLSEKYMTLATTGNLNNHIGVPLTLLSITNETEIAVIEMGANHPLEIKLLCSFAEPTHGIITNIGKAHLEGFGGFEGVIRTKKELYDYLSEHQKPVFYNADNALLTDLLTTHNAEKISYGINNGTNYRGNITGIEPYLNLSVSDIKKPNNTEVPIHSRLSGSYNAENILAACSIGGYFGITLKSCAAAIEKYIPTNNRSQLKDTGKNTLLLDCYNANPSSMEVALTYFAEIKASFKTIILGDMLELGEEAEAEHRRILSLTARIPEATILLVGDVFGKVAENTAFKAFNTVAALYEWINTHPIHDHYILIKGSRGIQLEKIIDLL